MARKTAAVATVLAGGPASPTHRSPRRILPDNFEPRAHTRAHPAQTSAALRASRERACPPHTA